MNEVTMSGVLKGGFEEVSNDGIKFTLVNRNQRGEISENEEFVVLAYGNSAQFLSQHAKSGKRVVIQGRLSSEKLGTDNYHTAITASRVLSIADSSQGIDYTHAVISGRANSDGLKRLDNNNKTPLINLNVANVRVYKTKTGEVNEYTTYLGGTVWGARAEELADSYEFPFEGVEVLFDGILKPRSYEKDGETVHKIDVWVNNLSVLSPASEAVDETGGEEAEVQEEAPAKPASRSKKLSDAPF